MGGVILNKFKRILTLFFEFFTFGCFTFGGGWSIVAQMQKIYVDKKKVITNEELMDIAGVGRSLPGTMIGNIAMMFGYRQEGYFGGVACLIGMILAPMLIISVITIFYNEFRHNYWINAAMKGIGCAVVPIIFNAALPMFKMATSTLFGIILMIVAFVAYANGINTVILVVSGAILGICFNAIKGSKEV